ncbi:ATP-binding protein [Vibrio paucivorans]|uniref:ATP-binding protein n=1 Tax=Vibrio paucivorans TaxID=2829489 RepID=A0A9X3CHZ3_9VIBR|nr:ATP-binding protein [Vibrio paucivorans]MCW8336030.1 ATP-binding protein [Vibrio paucivorans]
MHLLIRVVIAISLLVALPAQAQWEYDFKPVPEAQDIAKDIAQEVSSLPDPLFMSPQDRSKVRQLLNAVLAEQKKQIDIFDERLNHYRDDANEQTWFDTETSYLTLNCISLSKQRLLELTSASNRDKLTGFGPFGVTQFKQEWSLTRLNGEYLLYFQLRSFKSLVKDIFISPIPVIWAGLKVFIIYLVLAWWLRNAQRIITLFRECQLDNAARPPIWIRLIWYVSRAHRAIAWLIAITLSLRVLSAIPSLQHLIFLEIFTWWILGGSIAISFILEFTYRNSRSSNPEVLALRLSTVRRYVWSIIVAGVILQISMRTLGKGTIYYWIYSALFFWFVLVTISVLRIWRNKVFEVAEKLADRPVWVNWAISRKGVYIVRIVGTAIAALWIAGHTFKQRIVAMLSHYTIFSQALAYLFRIEVAKQTGSKNEQHNLVRVKGDATFEYVLPGTHDSELFDYATDEFKQLSQYLLSDSPAICVLSGERGIGTTTMLKSILNKVKNAEPVYLNCPYSGYQELLTHLAVSLGLDEDATEIQILSFLRKSDTRYLIAVDNAQRLVKPMVGGLTSLIKLTNLLRRSKKNHRVVIAIEKASWRFVDRARGERLLFDWVSFMPKWSEKQIQQLLDSRVNQDIDTPLSFDGLVVPKQWDQEEITEEERAKQGFYRILWHYSDGNPTVALRFFRQSLQRNKETEQVFVRLFRAPESQELEKMPKSMLAVLRSIVQLEIASTEELSECTQLSVAEVLGTLRYFQSRGFIEWSEDKARVSDHWFRHITNVLDRQHLLVK